MAIEDAVVLGRCLGPVTDPARIAEALQAYARTRQERTAKIQIGSRGNQWMKTQGNADWVYGYDAWTAPLDTH
jgi:salicylate hydroxylase